MSVSTKPVLGYCAAKCLKYPTIEGNAYITFQTLIRVAKVNHSFSSELKKRDGPLHIIEWCFGGALSLSYRSNNSELSIHGLTIKNIHTITG